MSDTAPLLQELRQRKSRHGKVMAVSMMKDEAPYLLEWFAHHLTVGFTDILVYTNDCTDGTVEMLQRLEELGLGFHRPNDIPEGKKPQPSAISYAQKEPLVADSDWVILFDADEYLSINHPSGHLDGMLDDAVAAGANGIVITWRIFGSGGIVDWSRAPVTEQYLRAAPPLWNKGWGVKTLFKFDPEYWKLGIHRPSIKKKHIEAGFPDKVHWLNGSGQPMEEYFKFRGWRSIRRTLGYDWAQMNHYAVKSVDAYALRKLRGNVNTKKNKYNSDYWSLQDRNEVLDRNILRHAPHRTEIMAALLTDPVLANLHEAALTRVEAKLAEYKKTEAYETFKKNLLEAGNVPISKVEAKPPKPRDPVKIAAQMSEVEQKMSGQPKEDKRNPTVPGWGSPDESPYVTTKNDLSEDIALEWVENQGLMLPADPRVFSPLGVDAVIAGKFERRHARNLAGYVKGYDRLLEIGCGVGFLAMKVLRDLPELVVMAHDERETLIEAARKLAARNEMEDTARLKLVSGPLRFASDTGIQANGLAAMLRDFQPGVLRLGVLPESPEILSGPLPDSLRRILIPWMSAEQRTERQDCFALILRDQGFEERPEMGDSGSLCFERTHEPGSPSDS